MNRLKTSVQPWRITLFMAVLCAVSWWSAPGHASGEPADLQVMSFNIRYSSGGNDEAAAENNWNDPFHPRKQRAIEVIRQDSPDLLGLQEPRKLQIDDLKDALPEMAFYGVGRDDGQSAGEFNGIFYRKDRFTLVDQGTFWLSDTPAVPGTSFYKETEGYPRLASWVKLREKRSSRLLLVMNTHWQLIPPARLQSAQLIRQRLATLAKGLPVILMGDLNSAEDSAEVLTVRGVDPPALPRLADSYREVHPEKKTDELSYHAYEGATSGSRIDFILHTDDFEATDATILRSSPDGRWPSDHYPVTATLRFKVKP
jgi:endonuclease/exonuclease/phosphatase family metal-dependent hydrolase